MVSRPRNHRYLRPRIPGSGAFVCEIEKRAEFSKQFNLELIMVRREANFVDECSEGLSSIVAEFFRIQGVG